MALNFQRSFLKESLRSTFIPYLLLGLAGLAAYSSVFANGFVGDDELLIVGNSYLRTWSSIQVIFTTSALGGSSGESDLYRPLQTLINLVIYQLNGLNPTVFHALSLALHIANMCLLYALGVKLGYKPTPALFASLLWGLHPLEAESVMHMSGVADPLSALFCFYGLLILLPDFSARKILYACPLMVLALLSKETAVAFPLIVVATMFLSSPLRTQSSFYLRSWPFWFIAAVFVFLRLTLLNFQGSDENFYINAAGHDYATHILWRLYTCLATLPLYLQYIFWPFGLHFEIYFPVYQDPWHWQVLLGAFFVLAPVAQIILGQGRSYLVLSWGLIWFGAALAPVSGILIPSTFLFSEHWMYLPTAGLFLAIAQNLAEIDRNSLSISRPIGVFLATTLVIIAGITTWHLNRVWHDGLTLYSYMLEFNEPLPRTHADIAEIYMKQGKFDAALAELRKANHLLDTIPEVHQDIAFVLVRQPGWKSHPQEAIAELNRALELRADYVSAYEGLVYIFTALGDDNQVQFYNAKISAAEARHPP